MVFHYFTPAEYAALPAERKRTAIFNSILGGKGISREVKLYVEPNGKETLAIITDAPPITEQVK